MHRSITCLSLATVLALATPAFADKPHDAPDAQPKPTRIRDRADELFSDGAKAYLAGRYAEAEQKLEQAWGIKRTHDIAGNLGVVKNRLGKYAEAAQFLAWSLLHFPPTESPRARQGYAEELARARAEVGALRVQVNVGGAEVTINGRSLGKAPLETEAFVEPGTANVTVRLDGYVPIQRSIVIGKGEAREQGFTLVPVESTTKRSIVPGVVLGSVAGAALITGISVFAAGRAKGASAGEVHDAILDAGHSCVSGAANHDSRCAEVESSAAAANTLQKVGVGLMIGAGVAAVGTVVYFALPQSSAKASKSGGLRLIPAVSPGNAGLIFSGTF